METNQIGLFGIKIVNENVIICVCFYKLFVKNLTFDHWVNSGSQLFRFGGMKGAWTFKSLWLHQFTEIEHFIRECQVKMTHERSLYDQFQIDTWLSNCNI